MSGFDDGDFWSADDDLRWTLHFVSEPADGAGEFGPTGEDAPFLLAPDGTFDPVLNEFFRSEGMLVGSRHTRVAYARDLGQFFSYVATSRSDPGAVIWRDISREDRRRYSWWPNNHEDGPHIAASTWNRESVAAYRFYIWAKAEGFVNDVPIRSGSSRPRRRGQYLSAGTSVAERRSGSKSGKLEWLDGVEFRSWRDVGIRGFWPGDPEVRRSGRSMSGRDAVYVNLMVRTGFRLEEQSSLVLHDLPERDGRAYCAGLLPSSTAKNGSGRTVYYADSVLAEVEAYRRSDRAWAVRAGRLRGAYVPDSSTWLVRAERPSTAVRGNQRVKVDSLTPADRRKTLVETADGWEPAILWLTREGAPMTLKGWQGVFERANGRCRKKKLALRATPHTLRHSFAVATLEQLQRGHNELLAAKSEVQRRHYQMVFGDPLNFLRILLGHKSVASTTIYLHALAELEMQTRLMLLGDDWGLPPGATSQQLESGAS